MTFGELLAWGRGELSKAGVPEKDLDARYLLLDAFSMSLASFLARQSRELGEKDQAGRNAYEKMIAARASRIPLQQILGVQEFMGLEFQVNESVLIPRQDTETLVELVLEQNREENAALLDLCTGSGCIAISLAKLGGYRQVWALDLSKEALEVARNNAQRLLKEYKGQFHLICSDLFQEVPQDQTFDVIVSNPPYIPSQEIDCLEPEVKDHEPRMALDGDWDGLSFYRAIAPEAMKRLVPGGKIYVEIGWDQGSAVQEIFSQAGFADVQAVRDLSGNCRVVWAVRPGN